VSKERTLLAARLDRELAPEDEQGPAVRSALSAFWKAQREGVDSSTLEDLAGHVYAATRQVQKDRWRRLKTKYGDIHHYFTPFGQIKSEYKIPATPKHKKGDEEPGCMGCLVVLILVAAVAAWWWFW
jgi:hypothetical protein